MEMIDFRKIAVGTLTALAVSTPVYSQHHGLKWTDNAPIAEMQPELPNGPGALRRVR
jgi:hypothetical protein